jgi:CheY-like chemotaxis protein
MNPKNILFVDDQSFIRHFYTHTLKKNGYHVIEAENGEEALAILESGEAVDVIFLDAVMPVMDGFETCEKVRDNKAFSKIPIVFLTGNSDKSTISKAMGSGATDYLVKGSNPEDILEKLDTLS